MTEQTISKSRFKARALEHLRRVERTGRELVITDRGTPVVRVVPYERDPRTRLESLRGSILRFRDPTKPVDQKDWKALR